MNKEFILHLPSHLPQRRGHPHKSLDAVTSIADLPPYLFMGHLDEPSFNIDSSGWSATWRRDEDSWFHIDYDAKDACIHAREQWLGYEGFYSCMHHNELGRLAQMRFISPVQAWESRAEEVIQTRWNLKYLKAEEGDWMMAGIPDGLMKTLMLPLPADALPLLVKTFSSFRDDPAMDFPVSGYVLPVMGAVNYIEGMNPDWSHDPDELFVRTFLATGFPVPTEPVRECANDGSAAWTVRRLACMAFIGVPFAGMIPFLESLEQAGLLAGGPMKSSGEGPGLGSVEFSGCVMPVGKEFSLESLAWWPEDRRRRVFWLMPDEHLQVYREHADHRDDSPEFARQVAYEIVEQSRKMVEELLGGP